MRQVNEPGLKTNLDLSPCEFSPIPGPHHEVGDGVGVGRRQFPHAVVGHGPHAQHSLLLEHPAGQGDGQLVIPRLRVPAEEGR